MKLQYKLFILLVIIILIIGTAAIISTATILKRGLEHSLIARERIGLELLKSRIFPHLANRDYEKVTWILFEEKAIKKELIYYIAVHDKSGNILSHTFLTDIPAQVKNCIHRDIGDFSTAELSVNNTSVTEMVIVIKEGAYEIGHLCIGYKKEYIENIIFQIIRAMASTIIILAVFSTILSFFLSRYIVKPIEKLSDGMEEVSKGNLDYKIETSSKDEIGALTNSFNKMTSDLQKDISEKKSLETKLIQSEKMSAIGQLAAGLAHEINNPLGVIMGFAQGLSHRIKDGDPFELPIKSIEREAIRCKNLVQDLLTFSRVSTIDREPLDLNKIVEITVNIVQTQSKMVQVEIKKELAEGLPHILGNQNQIQQIIINLADNALDAMPKGGILTISTQLLEENTLSWVCLKVSDTGNGIPSEILPKIFNPFFTTKEVGKGTGLGLSLVYEIVQKHSGTIETRSQPKYTEFVIKFPARTGRELEEKSM